MELTVLRARAVCESCRSKLPPRTEAWWDEDSRQATCVTCERYGRIAVPEVTGSSPPEAPQVAPPTDPSPPVAPLTGSAPPVAPPPAGAAAPAPSPPVAPAPTPVASPTLDPEMTLPLDRGDAGEGRVGQVLEAARIHGLEVLHGLRISPALAPLDHLVVSANGVWVVHAVAVLEGRLERRDVGDWFNADPRLYVADVDRSSLVALVRSQVEAVSNVVVQSSFSDIPIRGVLSFGSVQPAWVHEPFVIDGISVTWRSRMVEPLLDPVLIGVQSRTALLHALAASVVPARSEGGGATDRRAGVADPSEHVAG